MAKVTQQDIDSRHATSDDDRTIAAHINSDFMREIDHEVADRQVNKQDFIIESLLKNIKERS